MIENLLKITLNENQYSSLCFLANNINKDNLFIDFDTAKKHLKPFIDEYEIKVCEQEKIKYILFTKE